MPTIDVRQLLRQLAFGQEDADQRGAATSSITTAVWSAESTQALVERLEIEVAIDDARR